MAATDARRATPEQRERMLAEFVRLCEIESPSRRERAVADAVTAELRRLGLEVHEDDTGLQTGSDAGNLLARVPGPDEGARTILLCAHLDTVPLVGGASVEVERTEEGLYRNRNEAILGADNKAAVAVMMEVARQAVETGAPVGIELLFTTTEELALAGAKAFDASQLQSDFGFVFDHASPIGELIVAAPTYFRIEASFYGQAAHAGIRPEAGRNAIVAAAAGVAALQLGRLDPETTSNVGTIMGGTEGNVVAERCDVLLEARSLDHERAQEVTQHIVDALTASATDHECDVEIDVQQLFKGYRLPRTGAAVVAASAALGAVGIEPRFVTTGGGSDANAFIANGFQCLNLANGTVRNHQPDEAVSEHALVTMLDVALALVHASADAEPAEWGLPAEPPVPTAAATEPEPTLPGDAAGPVPEGETGDPLGAAPTPDVTVADEAPDTGMPPEGEPPLETAPGGEPPLETAPEGEPPLETAPDGEPPLETAPEGERPLETAPEGERPLETAPEHEPPLETAPDGDNTDAPAADPAASPPGGVASSTSAPPAAPSAGADSPASRSPGRAADDRAVGFAQNGDEA